MGGGYAAPSLKNLSLAGIKHYTVVTPPELIRLSD